MPYYDKEMAKKLGRRWFTSGTIRDLFKSASPSKRISEFRNGADIYVKERPSTVPGFVKEFRIVRKESAL